MLDESVHRVDSPLAVEHPLAQTCWLQGDFLVLDRKMFAAYTLPEGQTENVVLLYCRPLAEVIIVSPYVEHSLCCAGMSVTAGEFFKPGQMVFAAGAPRAGGTGQVVLFSRRSPAETTVPTLNVMQIIPGEQFASSFGYEVATADINGDK